MLAACAAQNPTLHVCYVGPNRQVICAVLLTRMLTVQAAGLPRNSPRKDWPLPLLRQVLTESIQETPRQLLARELWCGSGSASEWWTFQAGYTSSTAAFSMVPFSNSENNNVNSAQQQCALSCFLKPCRWTQVRVNSISCACVSAVFVFALMHMFALELRLPVALYSSASQSS